MNPPLQELSNQLRQDRSNLKAAIIERDLFLTKPVIADHLSSLFAHPKEYFFFLNEEVNRLTDVVASSQQSFCSLAKPEDIKESFSFLYDEISKLNAAVVDVQKKIASLIEVNILSGGKGASVVFINNLFFKPRKRTE